MNARKTVVALLTVVAVIAVLLALNLVLRLADTSSGLQVIDVSHATIRCMTVARLIR